MFELYDPLTASIIFTRNSCLVDRSPFQSNISIRTILPATTSISLAATNLARQTWRWTAQRSHNFPSQGAHAFQTGKFPALEKEIHVSE